MSACKLHGTQHGACNNVGVMHGQCWQAGLVTQGKHDHTLILAKRKCRLSQITFKINRSCEITVISTSLHLLLKIILKVIRDFVAPSANSFFEHPCFRGLPRKLGTPALQNFPFRGPSLTIFDLREFALTHVIMTPVLWCAGRVRQTPATAAGLHNST